MKILGIIAIAVTVALGVWVCVVQFKVASSAYYDGPRWTLFAPLIALGVIALGEFIFCLMNETWITAVMGIGMAPHAFLIGLIGENPGAGIALTVLLFTPFWTFTGTLFAFCLIGSLITFPIVCFIEA